MRIKWLKVTIVLLIIAACGVMMSAPSQNVKAYGGSPDEGNSGSDNLSGQLGAALRNVGFTGRIADTLEDRLGRHIDDKLANIGRLLWFDTITGLNNDNTCAGCHSPTNGFGDTQSIAIGIENNGIVGPHRTGPRNQRRTPLMINTAFFPTLMWNSRFASLSNDPFNNSAGFIFPAPEGLSLSYLPQLLVAQAFIPPTERTEVAGFDFPGDNFAIRVEVLRRLNAVDAYRNLFGQSFPEVNGGAPINFDMFGKAIAEFEFSMVFADAPIDKFARGKMNALTDNQKKGALLFFGRAGCVTCHAVSGQSNEMFSDFKQHVLGVPQIVPKVGKKFGNVVFDGPGADEDFGLEQVTGDPSDRYKFRTSPIRNVALQPTFMHNGAFTRLEDAIRHHLDVFTSARNYNPTAAGVAPDLRGPLGPIEPVLARIDPLVAQPTPLTNDEFNWLVDFVRNGLLDDGATPQHLRSLAPNTVPSGRPVLTFEFPAQ
jgi:cytochrome c peroxidase